MSEELRQAVNKIEVTGVVKEHRLEARKGDNGNYINGSLVVAAGEDREIEVRVFVNELTREGNPRRVYSTLKQFVDGELKTLADKIDEEEATKVRIWGNGDFTPQFREEIFATENSPEPITTVRIDLGFGNVTIDDKVTPEDYKATFDVEMFVREVVEEEKNDEETGRVIVKGYVPAYGGTVFPLDVVAGVVEDEEGEFDFAEELRDSIDAGTTINLWGDINYKAIIEQVKKGGSLGRAKVEEKRTYINDLVAVGGDIIEDPDKEFDEDLIREALNERQLKIEEVKNQSKEKNKKGKGLGGRSGKGKKTASKNDDIPF